MNYMLEGLVPSGEASCKTGEGWAFMVGGDGFFSTGETLAIRMPT